MKIAALIVTSSLLTAQLASAQPELGGDIATPSASALYALLIVVFAVVVAIGLWSSRREQDDDERADLSGDRHRHSGSADIRTLRRHHNDEP